MEKSHFPLRKMHTGKRDKKTLQFLQKKPYRVNGPLLLLGHWGHHTKIITKETGDKQTKN